MLFYIWNHYCLPFQKSTMKIKQNLLIGAIMLTGLYSCTESKKQESGTSSGSLVTDSSSIKGCYLYIVKKDTIQLAVTSINKEQVEGTLLYNFFEKDDSKGTFTGTYKKGILSVKYNSHGEGTNSFSQVIFKKVDGGFIEGTGKTKTIDNKQVFIDPASVSYDSGIMFSKNETCLP